MEQHQSYTPGRRPQRRRDGAMLAGVCTGLGEYLGTNPNYVRAAFVGLTAVTAGTGVLAYLVAYFLMPADGQGIQQGAR